MNKLISRLHCVRWVQSVRSVLVLCLISFVAKLTAGADACADHGRAHGGPRRAEDHAWFAVLSLCTLAII